MQLLPPTAFPVGPLSQGGLSENLVSATIGNIYYAGSGFGPIVMDLLSSVRSNIGTNMTQMIGSKILLQRLHTRLGLHFNEDQAVADQGYMRVTVVQAKDGAMTLPNQGVTQNDQNLSQYVFLGAVSSNFSTGPSQWTVLPVDRSRFKVLYDKVKHRHATPITVTAQANCHFKTVWFDVNLNFRRGKVMQYSMQNTSASVSGRWVNPIFMIIQAGDDNDGMPVTPALTAHSSVQSSHYISFRDA